MNPTFLDNMSWEMAEVYGAITDQILINLAKYFPYVNAGNVPKSSFDYMAVMLAQMGQVNRETMQIIRNGLQGADKTLSGILEQTIINAVSKADKALLKGVKAGILMPAYPAVLAPNQYHAFQLYYQQAAQKLNLVNTVMLESTQQAYQATVTDIVARVQATQTALDIGTGETITGVSTWNQAMRHSIDRMKQNGVIGFIDHAGHRWSAEAYTAMDIRTTVYNTGRAAVWEANQNFGNDLYIVSYHDGARELCFPWQNKVISSTNNARTVIDLDGNEIPVYAQSDTSYGLPAGLFGINCKHYPSPFIPGVSTLYDSSDIQDEKENKEVYEQVQKQRALERKLREEKRDLLIEKARGADEDTIKALRERCRKTSDDIDDFCNETGLPRRQNREGVYTKREFPDVTTYDPKDFERTQKDLIDSYYRKGGEQQGYTFGQMTPNVPLVPNPAPPAAPVTPVAPANTQVQTPTQATADEQYIIDGNIEKLKKTMTEEEYKEAVTLIENGETGKLYEKYGDKCAGVVRKKNSGQYYSWDVVEYDFEVKPGMSKFSTMAHEMAHMFDAKIADSSTLTFTEVGTINNRVQIGSGASKTIKVTPSTSDQFLSAMRKDKITLKGILSNPEEIGRMKSGSWRNATAGVQDAMDGFFGTQDRNILPWGHGDRYYNKWYNSRIKDFGLQSELKEAFVELGFDVPNLTVSKQLFREYRTASELWANIVSALTCGGEELEAFETYMPETVEAVRSIIRGL